MFRSSPRALARPAGRPLAALLLSAAAACGSDRATAPDAGAFDLAAVLDAAALPTAYSARAAGAGMVMTTGLATPPGAAARNCAWSDGLQAFACAPVSANGLTFTTRYTPLDAAGRPQAEPTRGTTAAVRSVTTVTGTPTAPPGSSLEIPAMSVDMRSESTVRGLLSGPRVVDGTSTSTLTSAAGPGGGGSAVRITQATSGLVLPENGGRYPLAGTITSETLAEFAGGTPAEFTRVPTTVRSVMTFNGTSVVRVDITIGGQTQRCTFDLAAPASANAFRCS